MSDEKAPEVPEAKTQDPSTDVVRDDARVEQAVGVRRGMFGAHDTGDTSGYGGLVAPVVLPGAAQLVGRVVEPLAVGPLRSTGHLHPADQAAVAGRVAGAVRAEHAAPHLDRLEAVDRRLVPAVLGEVVELAHRSSPFMAEVGVASSAASSASRAAFSRFTPSGVSWICWCSLMIASSSISGRGGQPGR